MTTHSLVAPSSASRVVQCPGSLLAELQYPEAPDALGEAAEGNAAHWVIERITEGHKPKCGDLAPNGIVIADQMLDGAELMIDTINADLAVWGKSIEDCAIEQRVDIPAVHPTCFGTPDARTWVPPQRLFVWDYKFGHRPVEVFENTQLVAYAAGCIAAMGLPDSSVFVHLCLVQPRCYHREGPVRRWLTTGDRLRAYVNRYRNAVEEALSNNPPRYITGPECRDCRARHACAALQTAAYNAVDESTRQVPLALDAAALGLELRILDTAAQRLEARRNALTEQVLAVLKAGELVPGWTLDRTPGRTVWKTPAAEVIAMGKLLGFDLAKAPEAMTPKQAEKVGFPADLIATLAEKGKGAVTLARDDGTAARRVFG